jgi:hypothetical protein
MEGEGETMKKLEIIQGLTNLSKEWTQQTKGSAITRAAGKLRNVLRNLCSLCYTWFPRTFSDWSKNTPQTKIESAKAML